MPKIEVKDANGEVLNTYEIIVAEYGTLVTEEDVFRIARMNAVEDEYVNEDEADQLTCRVVE